MTRVVFENATIQDVVGKAAKIAPTRGSAFEKSAGILVEVDAENQEVTVRATDGDLSYLEVVDAIEIEGPSALWLLPSITLGALCAKLPIGSGKQINWEQVDGSIKFTTGKMRASIQLQASQYYPTWEPFDPAGLEDVSGFGGRVGMVSWAASKTSDPPLSGVHFDGEWAIATDGYRLVRVPCVAPPIYKPITVPAGAFAPLGKIIQDASIAIQGEYLVMMPDDSTQIRALMYGLEYKKVNRVFEQVQSHTLKVDKEDLREMIDRASVMTGSERVPTLSVFIGQEEIACYMEQKEVGMLGDVLDVPGYAQHDYVKINFTPKNLIDAVANAPSKTIEIGYNADMTKARPVKIDGGSGYVAMVMPRTEKEMREAAAAAKEAEEKENQ